jgi:DNA-binding response OmpR family regulator
VVAGGGAGKGRRVMKDGKQTILCVDDDADVLHFLRVALTENGYHVVEAATAEEGVKKFRQVAPDAVIVDLMMEEIDAGTNFVREIGAAGRAVPVFMLSSVGDQLHMSTDYSTLGLAGILQKPISPAALVATLQTRLAQNRRK